MSDNKFDQKVREKLEGYRAPNDKGAWEQFSKLLPTPWFKTILGSNAGWGLGAISTIALLVSFLYFTQKNNQLTQRINLLENKAAEESRIDTVFVNNTIYDTVYQMIPVTKYVTIKDPIHEKQKVTTTSEQNLISNQNTPRERNSSVHPERSSNAHLEQNTNDHFERSREANPNVILEPSPNNNPEHSSTIPLEQSSTAPLERSREANQNATPERSSTILFEQNTNDPLERSREENENINNETLNNSIENKSDAISTSNSILKNEPISSSESKENLNKSTDQNEKTAPTSLEPIEKTEATPTVMAELKSPEEDQTIKEPEVKKRTLSKINANLGLNFDLLGLNRLAVGPAVELFLNDKFSFNTGILISNPKEDIHPLVLDYNRRTGHRFEEMFRKYVPQRPELIEDIRIKTSFVKLPLFVNYYVNTWSRFSFMLSAGTKLDLSVYQDIDYNSGPIGQQLKSRFEARPKPAVFNNFFYGMGAQYKNGRFVAQLSPYFDFAFRKPDYFTPNKNFGLNTSLKIALTK